LSSNKDNDRINELLDKHHDLEIQVVQINANLVAHFKQDEKISDAIQLIAEELHLTNEKLSEYNAELRVHIAGVGELRKANEMFSEQLDLSRQSLELQKKEFEVRFSNLEKPRIWLAQTGSYAKWIGAVTGAATALFAIFKFIQHTL
jgi:chromosome segregation ATPase